MLKELQEDQEKRMSIQEKQEKQNKIAQAMMTQGSLMLSKWAQVPSHTLSGSPSTPVLGNAEIINNFKINQMIQGSQVAGVTSLLQGAAAGTAVAASSAGVDVIAKAGDIMYGVMTTGLNSDEPGPVLAKIVSGRLKGSTLIGAFTKGTESVAITFSTINIPGRNNSVGINAFAIDQDTARTAVADDVDKHLLQRYGSLFGGTFLSGISQAVQQAGASFAVPTDGSGTNAGQSLVKVLPQLNTTEKVIVALGAAGQALGQVAVTQFNTPTTITVNAGSPIGIFFMSDFRL